MYSRPIKKIEIEGDMMAIIGEKNSRLNYNVLPLTLSVETLGGITTPLVLRGTTLPTKRRKVFSTAANNQESVESLYY